ncbi:MAG: thiamine-phosphate kinase [Deltaproteobacteria bacterium]|nr:thiamine-phosphate kinase [Deltaproteobacteria bacterium]
MLLKDLGEDHIVKQLACRLGQKHPRLIKGIGDDTSVTVQRTGRALLSTTDTLIEGVHFSLSYAPARLIGRKSLSISVSDIAAMGGVPLFGLVSIAMPGRTEKRFLDELYKGLQDVARSSKLVIVGGNTARFEGAVIVSTTVIGEAPGKMIVYRSGARPGDIIYVTGTLGDSALGLRVLQERGIGALKSRLKKAVIRHLDPQPRLAAGVGLSTARLASAMIDVSDGLLLDLKRLCEASAVSAVVELSRVPVSRTLEDYCGKEGLDGAQFSLSGGEDYELLFTSPPSAAKAIERLSKRLKLNMTPIGKIAQPTKKGSRLRVLDKDGASLKITRIGFEHF